MATDASVDKRLPWSGLLSPSQVSKLKEELPNFAVCPAFTGRFGSPDSNGLVKLPNGSGGLYHCKRSLKNWQSKLDDEKYKWWATYMAEKNIKPVMIHEVLNGLNHTRWKEYVTIYKRATSARLQRIYTARKKAQILKDNQQDRSLAQDLLNLAQQRPSEEAGSSADVSRGSLIPASISSASSVPSTLRRSKRSTAGARSKGGVGGH